MQGFIHQKNLEHYRKLLAAAKDDAERRILRKLLADEKSKDKTPQNGQMSASVVVNPFEHGTKERGGGS